MTKIRMSQSKVVCRKGSCPEINRAHQGSNGKMSDHPPTEGHIYKIIPLAKTSRISDRANQRLSMNFCNRPKSLSQCARLACTSNRCALIRISPEDMLQTDIQCRFQC